MVCIYCSGKTQVVNSRHQSRVNHVWRRRQCQDCKAIFTTAEQPELARSWAYSAKDETLHTFVPEKLLVSLYDSLRHRLNPSEDAAALTQTVINKLAKTATDGKVPRRAVVEACTSVLKHFDKAAATYYAAYHPI